MSLVRSPRVVGMVPVSWLPARLRVVSSVRLPSCGGMVPRRPLLGSCSLVTRPLVVVTPCQELRLRLVPQ